MIPALLADPSPNLRRLVLLRVCGRKADDPEVRELEEFREEDPLAAELLATQEPDGSWPSRPGGRGDVMSASLALTRLGFLGFGPDHPAVRRGAEFLFSRQRSDGSWPLTRNRGTDGAEDPTASRLLEQERLPTAEGYAMMPLQTAHPLRGLAASGYATDPRAEKAYEWLGSKRLPDGAWPTGIAKSGVFGRVAGYRGLPHSRWGCRATTTGVLGCLALHPQRRNSPEALRALDLLLGRETRDEYALGFELARTLGAETAGGFLTFHARFDPAFLLGLCSRIGATKDDARARELADFVASLRGEFGLWDYPRRPQISRWLSFDVALSLASLAEDGVGEGGWIGLEPRTPFRPYRRKERRY